MRVQEFVTAHASCAGAGVQDFGGGLGVPCRALAAVAAWRSSCWGLRIRRRQRRVREAGRCGVRVAVHAARPVAVAAEPHARVAALAPPSAPAVLDLPEPRV
eukprot:349687-Chlamydomonas_euryale.AAC.9